jgi:hypothetical protein
MDERPEQSDRAFSADHVDLRRERLKVRFLFTRFSPVHDMAKRTRMRAVKRLRDGFA